MGAPAAAVDLAHPHARLRSRQGRQHVDTRVCLFIPVAGSQHHALTHTEFHLARGQVRDHHGVFAHQVSKPKLYNPRHPERTLLYQTVAEHYETWLELASAGQFDGQGDHHTPKPFVRKAFATYLECGTSDKRGAKADELHLTPLELIDRIAALVPPPRTHRHAPTGTATLVCWHPTRRSGLR